MNISTHTTTYSVVSLQTWNLENIILFPSSLCIIDLLFLWCARSVLSSDSIHLNSCVSGKLTPLHIDRCHVLKHKHSHQRYFWRQFELNGYLFFKFFSDEAFVLWNRGKFQLDFVCFFLLMHHLPLPAHTHSSQSFENLLTKEFSFVSLSVSPRSVLAFLKTKIQNLFHFAFWVDSWDLPAKSYTITQNSFFTRFSPRWTSISIKRIHFMYVVLGL